MRQLVLLALLLVAPVAALAKTHHDSFPRHGSLAPDRVEGRVRVGLEERARRMAETLRGEFSEDGTVEILPAGADLSKTQTTSTKPAANPFKRGNSISWKKQWAEHAELSTWDPNTGHAFRVRLSEASLDVLRYVDTEAHSGHGSSSFANSLLEVAADKSYKLAPDCCCNLKTGKSPFDRDRIEKPYTHTHYQRIGLMKIGCTATMIDERVAITAAHCLMNKAGGEAYDIKDAAITFGQDGAPAHARKTYKALETWVLTKYKNGDADYDMGYVVLEERAGKKLGWVGLKANVDGEIVELAGYPQEEPSNMFFLMRDKCKLTNHWFTVQSSHWCDTEGGNSGSAIVTTDHKYVVAVHDGVNGDRKSNFALQLESPGTYEAVLAIKKQYA